MGHVMIRIVRIRSLIFIFTLSAIAFAENALSKTDRSDRLGIICSDGRDSGDAATVAAMARRPDFDFDLAEVQCAIELDKVRTLTRLLDETRDGVRFQGNENISIPLEQSESGAGTVSNDEVRSMSLFEYALLQGSYRSAKFLLAKNEADIRKGHGRGDQVLFYLTGGLVAAHARPSTPDAKNERNRDTARALDLAAKLLSVGADLDFLDEYGRSAVAFAYQAGERELGLLFAKKSSIAAMTAIPHRGWGHSAIDWILVHGDEKTWGAVEHRIPISGWLRPSAFEYALEERNAPFVAYLLDRGFSPNAALSHFASPLHALNRLPKQNPENVERDRTFITEVAGKLLEAGADAHLVNADGQAAAEVAAMIQNEALLRVLGSR